MDPAMSIGATRDLYSSVPLADPDRQIRVLDLHPGTFDAQVSGTLRIASPSTVYEALSYTWGLVERVQLIHLNGSHSLPITPNLSAALKCLRYRNTKRSLWVDAICMNQTDTREKTAQIGMMAYIFSTATCVNVWLGEYQASYSDRMLLAYMRVKGLAYHYGANRPLERGKLSDPLDPKLPGERDSELLSLEHALDRAEVPWHSRMWILQEYVLARRIFFCWGSWRMEWDDQRLTVPLSLSPLRSRCEKLGYGSASAFFSALGGRLDTFRRTFRNDKDIDLLYALRNCAEQSCGDPRDRIYALLGLVGRQVSSHIHADYEKAYAEVYARTTFAFVKMRDSFDILCYKAPSISQTEVPSWAVDFRNAGTLRSLAAIPHGLQYHRRSRVVRDAVLDDTGLQFILPSMAYELVQAVQEVDSRPSGAVFDTLVSSVTWVPFQAADTSTLQTTGSKNTSQPELSAKGNRWLTERLSTFLKAWKSLAARTRGSHQGLSNDTEPSVAFISDLGMVGFAVKGISVGDELAESDMPGQRLCLRKPELGNEETHRILVGGADVYRPMIDRNSSWIEKRRKCIKSFTIV